MYKAKTILKNSGIVLAAMLAVPVILYGMVFTLSIANAAPTKDNICHATASESNPWEAISIADNQDNHDGHVKDFPYNGPVKTNGQPVNDKLISDGWCEDNAPVVTPDEPVDPKDPQECPAGQFWRGGCVSVGTCPYADGMNIEDPKCVAPNEVENTTSTPVINEETEVFYGK